MLAVLWIVLQGSDFDFVDKKSLQADAVVPDADHTFVDDEDGLIGQQPDHEYGSGDYTTDVPDSAGIRYPPFIVTKQPWF